jgi:hypothetical protein
MTVRVVDDGVFRAECKHCDSVLEYVDDDIELFDEGSVKTGRYIEMIKCPVCEIMIHVNKGFVRVYSDG